MTATPRGDAIKHRLALKFETRTVAIGAVVAVLVYLVLGPILMLLFSSFRETEQSLPFEPDVAWTLGNYVAILTNPRTWAVVGNTGIFAFGSLGISFTLSVVFAWLIERTDLPLRNVLFVVIVASIGIPAVISGIAWILLFNPTNGLINIALRDLFNIAESTGPLDVYSLAGMTVIQGIAMVPISFLLVVAPFRNMDSSLEEAASASGARFSTVMRRVTLPLLTPALLSALIYQFVTAIESFDIPLVVGLRGGVRVLSTEIYLQSHPVDGLPNFGIAAAYSVALLALVLTPLLLYNRVIARSERFATVSGRGYHPRRVQLGALKLPALALSVTFILVSLVLPVLVLLWTSLQPFYAVPNAESLARVSLDSYAKLVSDPRLHAALGNTVLLGAATALGTMTLAFFVSWILVRTKSRLRVWLDLLAFTPHVMPGVILGLSVLLIYLLIPVPIYGTLWIIVIALGTQYISVTTRIMTVGISQIQLELEEAAGTSGAPWWPTMRRVVLPLVMPAFLNGMLLVFLLSIKNLTMPVILGSQQTAVISTYILHLWEFDINVSGTAAAGTLMVGVTLLLGTGLRWLSRTGAHVT